MSTTNDEQAKYGEQPKEREPMLSDEQINKLAFATPPKENIYQWGSAAIRDHYEHLITTGKLRVVEECQVHYSESVHNMPMYGCRPDIPLGGGAHCPYCGNKIKR